MNDKKQLQDELDALNGKIDQLFKFIMGNDIIKLKKTNIKLIVEQLNAMLDYSCILKTRIENWEDIILN